MLFDVDESLRTMLKTYGRVPKDVEVVFDAPTKDWAARRGGPAVDVFLYDIRENLERRQSMHEQVRDQDNGRAVGGKSIVTGRVLPTRWFNCSYLVTAWTQRADDEHRILGSILEGLLMTHSVPVDCLRGRLAQQERQVFMTLARPLAAERSVSDIWSALGGELKPSLDLVVVVPFEPMVNEVVGPPVMEAPSLYVNGVATARAKGDPGRTPGHRRAKAQAESNGPDDVDGKAAERQPVVEELAGGTPEQPGRRFRFGVMEVDSKGNRKRPSRHE